MNLWNRFLDRLIERCNDHPILLITLSVIFVLIIIVTLYLKSINNNEPKDKFLEKTSKYYKEIFLESFILLFLSFLWFLGFLNVNSIFTDGTFILAIIALPVTALSYFNARKESEEKEEREQNQLKIDTVLNNLLDITKDNPYQSSFRIEVKNILINELNNSYFDKNYTSDKKYIDLLEKAFFAINTSDSAFTQKTDIQKIKENCEQIVQNCYDNIRTFNRISNQYEQINKNKLDFEKEFKEKVELIFKNENLKWKEKFTINDSTVNNSESDKGHEPRILFNPEIKMNKVDYDHISKFFSADDILISPNFIFDNKDVINSIFKDNLEASLEEGHVIDINSNLDLKNNKPVKLKSVPEVEIYMDDTLGKIPDRKILKSSIKSELGDETLVKFSTTYTSNDEYYWHTWFSFTNSKIASLNTDNSEKIVLVADGNPKIENQKSTKNYHNRMVVFEKEEFTKLINLKTREYNDPNDKVFLYINFTAFKEEIKVVDTRDIINNESVNMKILNKKDNDGNYIIKTIK